VVDKYSEDKGFGYVVGNDGRILLVERSSIEMEGYKTLVPGDRVTFDAKETYRGLKALNVKKL
jgi:CspA family cold shock protein